MKYVTSDLILVLYYFNEQGKNVHIVDLLCGPYMESHGPTADPASRLETCF